MLGVQTFLILGALSLGFGIFQQSCYFIILFYFSHVLWGPEIFERNSVQTLTICLSVGSIITGNPILEVMYNLAEFSLCLRALQI